VRSAVDVRGDAVEVWLVDVGLDELIYFVWESEPLIEEHYRDLWFPRNRGGFLMPRLG
jgi:hypothetical protein